MQLEKLNDSHIDAFKEIISIGAGQSAMALSKFIDMNIHMKIPRIRIIPIERVTYELLDKKSQGTVMTGIFSFVKPNSFLDIIMLFDEKTIEILLNRSVKILDLDTISNEKILKIGKIISHHFVTTVQSMLQLDVPADSTFQHLQITDIAEAILNSVILHYGEQYDNILYVENVLYTNEAELTVLSLIIPSKSVLQGIVELI